MVKYPSEFEYGERVDMFRAALQEAIERRENVVQGEGLLSIPVTVGQAEEIKREARLLKCVWEKFKEVFEI